MWLSPFLGSGHSEETAISVAPDPVVLATGVLVERYRLDVERAGAMLVDMAAAEKREVDEYATWLVTACRAPITDSPVVDVPAVVVRAVEFIRANVHRSVGVDDIARAARIGTRGLQATFRKHFGQTPMAYLRALRMEKAHHDLVTGDPTSGDTVSEIAARWGYSNAGRFAIEYQKAFGCPPSATLRR